MGLWVRRVVALGALLAALVVFPSAVAFAETTAPTPPVSSAPVESAGATSPASPDATSTAEPEATSTAVPEGEEDEDLPDVPLDDTRTTLALVGAGVLALLAGVVVLVRR